MKRKKEVFKPLSPKNVKIFTCGPSIYQRPHIGNYRTFLYEDVLQRYLEYLGYKVDRVLNFTDVEDKAIDEAKKQNTTLEELTNKVIKRFYEDVSSLKIKLPFYIPRSSTSVNQAVSLIETLLKKGFAYWYDGDVFFDPLKFPGFGKLYGLDMSRWPKKRIRFRKDTYSGMRWNYGDFILWHGYKGKEKVYWDTTIGKGRPAWNIQDASIITKHLGYEIDISCGGVDNLFRHHDYTISIVESVSKVEFAQYWMHGEHLLVNGEKMSKSRGNVLYLDNVFESGYSPHHIRFFLIYGNYRMKKNYTNNHLQAAAKKIDDFKEIIRRFKILKPVTKRSKSVEELISSLNPSFRERMDDDLDVKGGFDKVNKIVTEMSHLELSEDCYEKLLMQLSKVDSVLKVIF